MKATLKGKAIRNAKTLSRERRHRRIRSRIKGTPERPRLAVFRSNKGDYAQIIDDVACHTIAQANWKEVKAKTPLLRAAAVGVLIAERATAKKVKEVVFDRAGFRYQGHVKALADAAREAGLSF